MTPDLTAKVASHSRERFERILSEAQLKQPRSPSVWATEVRLMPVGGPISGDQVVPYDHSFMPHAVEIMDAADDPSIRMIVNWSAVRDGKTAICLNVIGRTVTDSPGGIFSVHPIDDDVAKFSNDDVEPMIELCLSDYFVEKKSRDSGRTVNYKRFKGGSLRIVNAGSITKFRGSTVKVLCLHEADALLVESIYKALNRTQGLSDAIIFMESTGTYGPEILEDGKIKYNSVIHEHYEKGDMRKWFCKCASCGALQWLKYRQIRAQGAMHKARYHCEVCDYGHTESQWRRMVTQGKWYPTAGLSEAEQADIANNWQKAKPKQPEIRSYWRNGFNSLLPTGKGYVTKLHQFLAEGEAAKSSPEALKTWTNEIAAELWSLDADKQPPPPYQPILDSREDYATEEVATVPERGLVLTTMTDVHGDRLEVEWRAWARNEESWGMGHFVLFGDTNRTEVWNEWTKHLQRPWKHASGGVLRLAMGFMDGGWRVDPILATLHRLAVENVPGVSGKLRISKGVPQWQSVIHRKWATIKDRAKGVHIGTWCAKSLIYERLRWHSANEKPSAGYIHFGKSYSEEFIRQVVSESSVFQIIKGVNVETFENPESNRNEALDLLVGNLAAFRFTRWDFDTIEADLKAQAAEIKQPSKPKSEPPRERQKSWATAGMRW